jgi:hypothetical protein
MCGLGVSPVNIAKVVILVPLLAATSATAGTIDNPDASANSRQSWPRWTRPRLKPGGARADEAACTVYRTQFLSPVKARAMIAACKTGADRDQEVGRLDGNVEDLNTFIAQSCGGS